MTHSPQEHHKPCFALSEILHHHKHLQNYSNPLNEHVGIFNNDKINSTMIKSTTINMLNEDNYEPNMGVRGNMFTLFHQKSQFNNDKIKYIKYN